MPPLDGSPQASNWPGDIVAENSHAASGAKRTGTLAACSMLKGAIGLRRGSAASGALREWFEPHAELLPIDEKSGSAWDLVHPLTLKESFESAVDEACIFKLASQPTEDVYFSEPADGSSFIELCERVGARGIEFELVWCEDTEFLFERLAEFRALADQRLERVMGTSKVNPANIECLSSHQIWLLQKCRAAKSHGDLRGIEGLLCERLPSEMRDLEHYEEHQTGDLAIYGPAV